MTSPARTGYPVLYFGPLGRLLALTVPREGYGMGDMQIGSLHQALSGAATKDVFGYKRQVQINMDSMGPRAWSWFEMCYRGVVPGPYYLLDRRRRNRLGAVISANGISYDPSGVSPWTPANGTVTVVAADPAYALLPSAGSVWTPGPAYATKWVSTAAGVLVGGVKPIPVLPGEQLVFSAYVVAGAPTLEIVPYSASLVAGTAITGTVDVPGVPDRKYVTYTVPASGVAAVLPQIRAGAATTITTLAWQLSDASTPEPWVIGNGVPSLVFDAAAQANTTGGADFLSNTQSGTLFLYEA
jgi:hypothetical protein